MTPNATSVNAGRLAALQPPKKAQNRLTLQDPLAFEQAIQPSLRSSAEIAAQPASETLDREKAREIWENLSLEPQDAEQRLSERKRLLLRTENLAKESVLAKAQVADLQAQLAKADQQRFHHPVVYAGAMGLLGLGGLWLLERRRRMQSQDRELEMMAAQSPSLAFTERERPSAEHADSANAYVPQRGSTFSLEDSPDLAQDFATDLPGLPESAKVVAPPATPAVVPELLESFDREVDKQSGKALHVSSNLNLSASQPNAFERTPDEGILAASRRVFSSMLSGRKVQPETAALPSYLDESASVHPTTGAPSTILQEHSDDATQMLYDEEAQEAFEQELLAQQLSVGLYADSDPDRANIERLSQTQTHPESSETAMEHLLELRTAVSGLCALGRPEGAAKLLEEHIAVDPNTCAWGFLEYMHLCELIGWREEFESMRKRYRQQFNRMAPYWHEPNSHVLGLDGYARAAAELCAAWAQGVSHSRNTLSAWLAGPLLGRKLVQLPAYHDLFDLYEMLEFVDARMGLPQTLTLTRPPQASLQNTDLLLATTLTTTAILESEQEFVPTVSLLDLDYEFSSDVTLQEREVEQSEKSVTAVKTGNFSVDFNVAGTQMGALASLPADLAKK